MLQVFARLGENCRPSRSPSPSRSRCSIAREREEERGKREGAADEVAARVEVKSTSKNRKKQL